jgi:hypothetical protein
MDYDPSRMLGNSDGHGAWLPPPPDFACHSPFGGAFWFYPQSYLRNRELLTLQTNIERAGQV